MISQGCPVNYWQCWFLDAWSKIPSTPSHCSDSSNNSSNDLHLYSSLQFKNLGWFNQASIVKHRLFAGAKQKIK